MRVYSKGPLRDFWNGKPDAKSPLMTWYRETKAADWNRSTDIKERFPSASILKNGRVVFNIKGNKYRLVVKVKYEKKKVYIRFIGTHKEYDGINAEVI